MGKQDGTTKLSVLPAPGLSLSSIEKTQYMLILATLIILPLYFVRLKYGWISLNLVEIAIIVLSILWIWEKKREFWKFTSEPVFSGATAYTLAIALIFFGVISSTISNGNLYAGFGAVKGWFVFPVVFAFIFFDNLKNDRKLLEKAFGAIFFSGAVVSIAALSARLFGNLTYDGRLKLFYDSPNQLAMTLAPAFLFGIGLWLDIFRVEQKESYKATKRWTENIRQMFFIGLGLVLIAIAIYFTKSVGAWISLAAVLFLVLKMLRLRKKIFTVAAISLLLAAIMLLNIQHNFESKLLGDRSSLASRVIIWKAAVLMIKNNPVLGIGPAGFQAKYLEYQKYFPPYLEWAAPQPHSIYLAFWLEAGFTGFTGFIFLVFLFFRDSKKAIKNNRFAGLLCLAVMSYFLIHGTVDTTYWKNDSAIVFWLVVISNFFLARENKPDKEAGALPSQN